MSFELNKFINLKLKTQHSKLLQTGFFLSPVLLTFVTTLAGNRLNVQN